MVTSTDNPESPVAAADSPADPAPSPCHLDTLSPCPTSSLPPLSPRQSHLLNAFFSLRGDILALAESEKLSAADLNAWSSDPAVQQHIAALYDLHEAGLALAASRAKRTALDTLELLARTAEDPIERRRAAAAIIRPGSTRDINRPFAQPDDLDEDLDEDADDQSDESDQSDPSDLSDLSAESDTAKPELFVAPYPMPLLPDRVAIDAAVEALKKPRDRHTNCRPYHFFLPDATACGLPIPKDADDYGAHFAALFGHADTLVNEQRHFCARDALSINESAYRLTFNSQDGRPFEYHIELTRPDYGDYPKCWRIKSLNWTDRQDHVDPKRRAKAREAANPSPTSDSS